MSAEWNDDPFVDPDDPASIERAERRREREEKRRQRDAKKAGKEAPPPPPPKPAAPPTPPRTPEQEFWDEDPEPAPPVPGQAPAAPATADSPDPGMAERGRRRLFGRRKKSAAPPPPAPPVAPPASGGAGAARTPEPSAAPPATPKAPAGNRAAPKAPAKGAAPGEPKTEVQPLPPAPGAAAPKAAPGPSAARAQVDPNRKGGAPAATPKPVPPSESATPPEGDPLSPLVAGSGGRGAAGAAAAGAAGAAAAGAVARPADPSRRGTGETAAVTGQGATPPDEPGGPAFAPPPGPPEEPNTGEWQPGPERDWDFHDEGDPTMTGAARHGRRHGEGGGGRRGIVGSLLRHPFRILAVIVLLFVLWFLNGLFQPFHGDPHGRVKVSIPKGAGVGEVGDILEKRGVISGGAILDASTLFQIRTTLDGKRGDLIAGKHVLQQDMSYGEAIDALTKEPSAKAKPGVVTVTIPEGYHRTETAQLVKEDGLKGSYVKATKKSKYLKPAEYGGKGAKDLEGFLFPDTFDLKSGTPVKKLVKLQLQDFKKQIKKVNMKYANSKNLTIYDVVTIASLVEGEAGLPKQRKLVASVIYNRLREGETLGLDTTVRFATGNYSKPLTQKQLESKSPYNTRVVPGLPPGPISSPGLAALQAAAHPAKTDFFFYVTDPNSCGGLTFSKNEEEFLADAQKYEKAREKAGGNAPSTCGE